MAKTKANINPKLFTGINAAKTIDDAVKALNYSCGEMAKSGNCCYYDNCKGCPIANAYYKAIKEIELGIRRKEEVVDNLAVDVIKTVTKRIRYVIKSGTMFYVWSSFKGWHWANEQEYKKLMKTDARKKFVFYDKTTVNNIADAFFGRSNLIYNIFEF